MVRGGVLYDFLVMYDSLVVVTTMSNLLALQD